MTAAANVITGAKAKVKIGGVTVGYATGVSIVETTINGRVESLGFIDSREITPIGRVVTATASMIRIFNVQDAVVPNGDDIDRGDELIVGGATNTNGPTSASVNDSLNARTTKVLQAAQNPFNLEIYDNISGQVIYTVVNCRLASQNIAVDRASLMGVQVTMDAEFLVRHTRTAGFGGL